MIKYLLVLFFSGQLIASKEGRYDLFSDIVMYSAAATPFAYSVVEGSSRKFRISAIAHLSNLAITGISKSVSDRNRPDGNGDDSFFSGHTSSTAVSAGLMCYWEKNTCLPGLGLTATVGILRILANRHYWEDVVVGFAVGYANGVAIPTLYWRF